MSSLGLHAIPGPHKGQPVIVEGPDPAKAAGAIVLIHGRGAGAQSILGLGRELLRGADRRDITLLAPHASGAVWYPQRFIEPEDSNEPWLSSAREAVTALMDMLMERGLPARKILLAGFSQGACLVADTVARLPMDYAGALVYSGGLMGPPGTEYAYSGSLAAVPVLVGCSDVDMHIPLERVEETASVLEGLGAAVDLRIYPGMGHTVNEEELALGCAMINERL